MKYQKLFEIQIVHEYFGDDPMELMMVPDEETVAALKNSQLLVKNAAKGLSVWVCQEKVSSIPKALTLSFHVFPTSPYFTLFTKNELAEGKISCFKNTDEPSNNSTLEEIETDGGKRLNGYHAVAKIEIATEKIHFDEQKGLVYNAIFHSKSMKWKYYFVSKGDLSNLRIEDRNNLITFSEFDVSEDAFDQIADALRVNFPEKQLAAFETTNEVAIRNKGIKNVQLIQDDVKLIKHLPNPTIKNNGVKIIQLK